MQVFCREKYSKKIPTLSRRPVSIKLLVVSNYDAYIPVRPEAEILIGLQKTNQYEITVMTSANSRYAEEFRECGIRVIDFDPMKKFSWKYVRLIRDELKRGKYHILQLFNNKAIVNGIQASWGLPVKVVVYRGYTGNISWLDPMMYIKYLSPRVDRIICLVEAIREIFRRNLLFNKDKAVAINKGHDIAWYDGVQPVTKTSLGLPSDAFTFICVANSRRMKGIRYLLKATYYLPPASPIHLLLLGRDMDVPEFRRLIEKSPLRSNIHVLGFRKEVLPVVKACDAFVLSSIKGEAITKAVIEAMAIGICPLITDIPGNRGLVIDGECGKVVPARDAHALANAMEWLSANPETCKQYGARALEHINNNFNVSETITRYDALYRELYNDARKRIQTPVDNPSIA